MFRKNTMRRFNICQHATWLLLVLLTLPSCSDDEPVTPPTNKADATFDFINLYLEDAEKIFQFDGSDATSRLGYLWVTMEKTVTWDRSKTEVRIQVLRSEDRTELTRGDFPLNDGGKYMCFLTGAAPEDAFMQIVIRDDTPPEQGLAKFRLFHALPGDPAVDLYVGGTAPTDLLVSNLGWRSMSSYISMDPQALTDTLMIVEAGAVPTVENALVFLSDSNIYQAGHIYTLAGIRSQTNITSNRTLLIIEQE